MNNNTYKIAVPCLRGVIGDWVYYASIMSAKQITDTVSTVKDIREAKTLDEVLQRKLKQRKVDISKYLLNKESRFFNSIILGVFGGIPKWVEFDLTEKFDEILSDNDIENSESSMGIMVFNGNEKIFAIDGQHRVEGIKIAYNKTLKDSLEDNGIIDDQYPVIFIAHIDDEAGRKRTRRLFSDINTNAKPVSKGDKIIIDEDDIKAIVARRLYKNYSYFKDPSGSLISVSEQANLEKDNYRYFTNLITLHTVNNHLRKLYRLPRGTAENDIENIENFYKITEEFYNCIFHSIKEYQNFFIKKKIKLKDLRLNNKHLLFRPVGLILIARLYTYFYKVDKLSFFKNNINRLDFIFPSSPLNKVIWNNGKMEVRAKNQNLSFELCLYLLGEYTSDKTEKLLQNYKDIIKDEEANLPIKLI